jgi:nickel/cobalt transporter (NicO) family protein
MQKILNVVLGHVLALVASVFLMIAAASAQSDTAKSPLGLPPPAHAEATPPGTQHMPASDAGPVARIWNWILTTQSALNRDMAAAVKGMKSDNPVKAALTLIAIAFSYGVLHAAGPGHGKSVISAYVLTNRETVRRGIELAFLSAVFQALSAIVFVGIMSIVLRQTSMTMRTTEATIETISWGLVAAVGAYLLWRQIAPFLAHTTAQEHDGHGHDHSHGPDCACGHSHMAAPKDLQGEWSWRKALPLALSVGIRPCSGAILLLIFALSQGMIWAGIAGTFAMAFGTAITVSILATLAVSSRDWAARASGPGSLWAGRIQTAAGFAGAGLVFILGTAFFIASLKGPGPL